MDELLHWVLDTTCRLMQTQMASLHLLNEHSMIVLAARRGSDGTLWLAQRARAPFPGGTTEQICRAPHPILRNRLAADAPAHPAPTERHIQATLHVPLCSTGRLVGVLNAESEKPEHFAADHVPVLETLAGQVAPLVERAWLVHEAGAAQLRERRLLARVQRRRGIIESLRAAVERNRLLADHGQDLLVTVDRACCIGFISAQSEHMLGYRPEEPVGRPVELLLAEHEHAAVRRHLERALAGEAVPAIDLVHLRRRDGSVFEAEVHGANLSTAGRIVGRHCVVRDIAARCADELRRGERLRALGQMASGAAHQLNNLLAHIMGQAELALLHLRDTPPNPAQAAELLDALLETVTDGGRVIRRMQEFSRVRRDAPAAGPVDLAALVREAVAHTRPRWKDAAEAAGIHVEVHMHLPGLAILPEAEAVGEKPFRGPALRAGPRAHAGFGVITRRSGHRRSLPFTLTAPSERPNTFRRIEPCVSSSPARRAE